MKRFLLFAFDAYDNRGGMNEFYGHYDSAEEAHAAFIEQRYEAKGPVFYKCGHIYDQQEMKIIQHYYSED